jgi:hypothetical protein
MWKSEASLVHPETINSKKSISVRIDIMDEKANAPAFCTIEKANSMINKMIEEGTLDQLCVIVIDELHMVSLFH